MAKTKDGFYKQIGTTEGSNSYLLLAGGDYIGFSSSSGSNTVVQRDSSGFIVNSYFNTTSGGAERNASGLGYIAGFNTSDYYIRSYTSAAVKTWLGLGSNAYTSTAYLPLTGGTLTSILTIQSGNDSKIILNNTDTEAKYQQITFQQNGAEYGRLGTYGSDDLRWTNNTVLHAGNYSSYALPLSGGTVTGKTIIKKDLGANLSSWVASQHNGAFEVGRSTNTMCVAIGVTDDNNGYIQVKGNGITTPGNLSILPGGGTVTIGSPNNANLVVTSTTTASGFIKSGSSDSYVLLGGGGHTQLSNITPYEANLQWGGKNFNGTYGCIDAAMIPFLGANRLAFANPSGITVEYSRDSGGTWIDYGASDGQKLNLTSGAGSSGLNIGNADSTNKDNGTYQLRITINTGVCSIYTQLNKFCIYISTNGSSGVTCTIEKALESTPDAYSIVSDMVPISGRSGYNIINTPSITTYGNTPTSQYGRLRFIFRSTGGSTTYSGLQVINIFGFGGVGWTTPSSMARWGQMYTYDYSKNVTFPAAVTATSFNGTATAANKVNSTLTFTGYSTQTFNGSTNVSVAIPNNTNQLTNGANFITSSSSITGNAATATKLSTSRTIWGKTDTDGTGNISGALSGVSTISASSIITAPSFRCSTNNVMSTVGGNLAFQTSSGGITVGGGLSMYINGTVAAGGGTPTSWYWQAGSFTSWADFYIGSLNTNGTISASSTITTASYVSSAQGYYRTGSSNDYVLLGSGGHKAISDFRLQSEKVLKMVFRGYFTWTGSNSSPTSSNVVYSDFCTSYVISRVSTGRYRITFTGLKTTSSISSDTTLQIFGAGRNINSDGTPCHVSILNVSSNYFDIITADDAAPNDTSTFTLYINQML